jgi:hypothetical protein
MPGSCKTRCYYCAASLGLSVRAATVAADALLYVSCSIVLNNARNTLQRCERVPCVTVIHPYFASLLCICSLYPFRLRSFQSTPRFLRASAYSRLLHSFDINIKPVSIHSPDFALSTSMPFFITNIGSFRSDIMQKPGTPKRTGQL